jgi:hypothetical protein
MLTIFYLKLKINFNTKLGKFELEVTTFQMAVLFSWTNRAHDKLSYESLRLATELPDNELRRTLWVINFYLIKLFICIN